MASIVDPLTKLKALMKTADPSPQRPASHVYIWPDDAAQLTDVLSSNDIRFPVIEIREDEQRPAQIQRYTAELFRYTSFYEIAVFFCRGNVENPDYAPKESEKKRDWIPAVTKVLTEYSTDLCDLTIGQGTNLFEVILGHAYAIDSEDVFYALMFNELQITYEVTIPESA